MNPMNKIALMIGDVTIGELVKASPAGVYQEQPFPPRTSFTFGATEIAFDDPQELGKNFNPGHILQIKAAIRIKATRGGRQESYVIVELTEPKLLEKSDSKPSTTGKP